MGPLAPEAFFLRADGKTFRPTANPKAGSPNPEIRLMTIVQSSRNDNISGVYGPVRRVALRGPIPPIGADKGADNRVNPVLYRFYISDPWHMGKPR